jgi:hypothetical protein
MEGKFRFDSVTASLSVTDVTTQFKQSRKRRLSQPEQHPQLSLERSFKLRTGNIRRISYHSSRGTSAVYRLIDGKFGGMRNRPSLT